MMKNITLRFNVEIDGDTFEKVAKCIKEHEHEIFSKMKEQFKPQLDKVLSTENNGVTTPLLWKDVLDDFYIEHDKQIRSGEYKDKTILVFRDWLEQNYKVSERNGC